MGDQCNAVLPHETERMGSHVRAPVGVVNSPRVSVRGLTVAAVLATRFPEKAPELFAYQATIVRAERNYEGKRWVSYDRQFRWEALARKDLNWSVTDSRLYNEAFTGRAREIARCPLCLQDDHSAPYCPKNPDRQWFGWFPNVSSPWQPASPWHGLN